MSEYKNSESNDVLLVTCPECKQIVDKSKPACDRCGYPLSDMKCCPECNKLILGNFKYCDNCGYPLVTNIMSVDGIKSVVVKKRFIGTILLIISICLLAMGYGKINCDEYDFYVNHYEDCYDGWSKCKEYGNNGGLFSGTYRMMADEYQDMMKSDLNKINWYKVQFGIYVLVGVIFLIIAIYFLVSGGDFNCVTNKLSGVRKRRIKF